MLDLSTDIVRFVIDKAHEFHAKEGVVFPEDGGGDWALQVLENHANDLTYQELTTAINDLEPDQQVSLVALMWLGRGDYGPEEWDEALRQAGESWNRRTAEYLLSTPMLSDFLEEGLSLLGNSEET